MPKEIMAFIQRHVNKKIVISGKAQHAEEGIVVQKTTQRILDLITENPSITRKEISGKLGDITEDGIKYNLNKLKKDGLIERIGPDKGGYWKVIRKL